MTAQPPAGPEVAPALPPPETTEVYRPLSMLAVAGLGLAVLYSICVLVGGLVPFARERGAHKEKLECYASTRRFSKYFAGCSR